MNMRQASKNIITIDKTITTAFIWFSFSNLINTLVMW